MANPDSPFPASQQAPTLESAFPTASAPLPPPPRPLFKQQTWSPDTERDEAWKRRREGSRRRDRRCRSVTDDDLDELKASIELGFGFRCDSPEEDRRRLSETLPALGLYYAVNKQYHAAGSSDCDTPPPIGSPNSILDPGDDPETVKMKLRHWAQVVAFSVRDCSC